MLHNHNWIQPLAPFPLGSLAWVNGLAFFPGGIELRGGSLRSFLSATAQWSSGDLPFFAQPLHLNGLKDFAFPADRIGTSGQGLLFISIDPDFFYLDAYTPVDISLVFDVLFEYSSRWNGEVVWAVCLSQAWRLCMGTVAPEPFVIQRQNRIRPA